MMITGSRFWKLRYAVSATSVALLFTGGAVGAAEVPLVDGTHWTTSAPDVKKAYLVGLANAIQIEMAYEADGMPAAAADGFSSTVVKGMKGQTLSAALEVVDKWYAAHPESLRRPVVETIWFEMVVPGLGKNK